MKFLLFALLTPHFVNQEDIPQELLAFQTNKQIPQVIAKQVLIALSHYPELKEKDIRFVFQKNLKNSVMAARPVVGSLLRNRDKRAYRILIRPVFKLPHSIEPIHQIPDSVMIGWIGHELGHIMDYEGRNTWRVAGFGLSYWLSKRYIRKAERVADSFAVNRGMGPYLVATKEFILGHSELPQHYKDRIAKLYLSPDDILELVTELEQEKQDKQAEILEEEEQVVEELETGNP